MTAKDLNRVAIFFAIRDAFDAAPMMPWLLQDLVESDNRAVYGLVAAKFGDAGLLDRGRIRDDVFQVLKDSLRTDGDMIGLEYTEASHDSSPPQA